MFKCAMCHRAFIGDVHFLDRAFGELAGLGMGVALLPSVFLRGEREYVAFAPDGGIRANINTGRVGLGVKF